MCFWGHCWSKWTDPTPEKVDRRGGVFVYDWIQMRTCKYCNKRQMNTL